MKLPLRLLLLCAGALLAGCEKCQKFEYIYLLEQEGLVVLERKKNPFKQTYTTAAVPIKFKLSRNEFFIIFSLSEGYVPSMWAQVHAKKKEMKLAMVGKDVSKSSEMYRSGKGIDEIRRVMEAPGERVNLAVPVYILGRGVWEFKGSYKFQIVDANNTVLSEEQIHFQIRSDGKRCVYDFL